MRSRIAAWLRFLWPGNRQEVVVRAYQQALDPKTPVGSLVLADLAHLCQVKDTSVVPDSPHGTAFNEGKRAVWLHIQDMLDIEPDDIAALLREPRT